MFSVLDLSVIERGSGLHVQRPRGVLRSPVRRGGPARAWTVERGPVRSASGGFTFSGPGASETESRAPQLLTSQHTRDVRTYTPSHAVLAQYGSSVHVETALKCCQLVFSQPCSRPTARTRCAHSVYIPYTVGFRTLHTPLGVRQSSDTARRGRRLSPSPSAAPAKKACVPRRYRYGLRSHLRNFSPPSAVELPVLRLTP